MNHQHSVSEIYELPPSHELPSLKAKKKSLKTYVTETPTVNTISVLTYNVCLNDAYSAERIMRIITIIREKMPDVIALQELSVETLSIVDDRLSNYYYIIEIFTKEEGNQYGTCILCKKQSIRIDDGDDNVYYYDFNPTRMNRRVVGCRIEFNKMRGKKFHILTTHLESLAENDLVRARQFEIIKHVTENLTDCIVLGDFSVTGSAEEIEKKIQKSKFKDSWIDMGCPFRVKYTVNPKKNVLAVKDQVSRPDRILYHSKLLKTKTLAVVGTSHVDRDVPVQPSNHFGLYAEFELKN